MTIMQMAWRNVWRNKRRSWITITAMSIALFVMVQYSGLVAGYMQHMRAQVLELEMGAVQIHAPGYLDNASIYSRVDNIGALYKKLDAAGLNGSARLLGSGLAAAGENSSGALLIGVDPGRDKQVSAVWRHVHKGKWLDPNKPDSVVVGKWLARTLEVKPGAELIILSQAADGSQANAIYNVAGILDEVGHGIDQAGLFLTREAFSALMAVQDGAHRVIIAPVPTETVEQTAARVKAIATKADVKTWKELQPTTAQMLQSAEAAVSMMFMIVFVVIGILLLNTMLMAVFERIREIGVLKALGYGPFAVFRLIVLESGVQTAVAVAIGLVLSVPAGWYLATVGLEMGGEGMTVEGLAMQRHWLAIHSPRTVTMPLSILLFIVVLAVAYPAIKAALIKPIEAIRHR